ncbi:MAG: glycerol-3-phosphate 1-O-acyltransferase PlsY [Planctomycetota bacterium]
MPFGDWWLWLLAAYLCGSIPFGLLIGLSLGIDIRTRGSGNIGATNLGRVAGRQWGVLCFLLDLAKGLGPVLASGLIAEPRAIGSWPALLTWRGVGMAAVLGHVWPVWLKFKGGKGVATGLGVVLGMWPWLTLAGVVGGLLWLVLTYRTGYVSVGSVAAAVSLPVTVAIGVAWGGEPAAVATVYLAVSVVLAGLVVVRHRDNLKRLRAGTEGRVGWSMHGDEGSTPP